MLVMLVLITNPHNTPSDGVASSKGCFTNSIVSFNNNFNKKLHFALFPQVWDKSETGEWHCTASWKVNYLPNIVYGALASLNIYSDLLYCVSIVFVT